jgi:hypothetical protein
MSAPVFDTGLLFALAWGAPPAAVAGCASASAKNHFIGTTSASIRRSMPKTLD